ncbi:MAG: hypothetical protein AAF404_21445, partial [Pseudomonadota bacterium]
MPVVPLAIAATGMVTSVGLDSKSSCAAIRCAIDNFQETRFMDEGGEWQIGAEVPLEEHWRGRAKLIKMAVKAIAECLQQVNCNDTTAIPLILSLPETDRPGRVIDNDNEFFSDVENELGCRFAARSRVLTYGHTAAAVSLKHARELILEGAANRVLIAGVDSLLSAPALRTLQDDERLLTSLNSNGFIPGEAGSALLLERVQSGASQLSVHGLGFAVEPAPINSGLPLRAEGLKKAINASLSQTGCELHELNYRITDMTGEHYYFKEASLALSRTLKKVVPEFDIQHPTDCVGEVGAATGHIMLAYQNYYSKYSNGKRVLAHFADT